MLQDSWPYAVRGTAISCSEFRDYLRRLRDRFKLIDEEEVNDRLSQGDMGERTCWITFDDGYRDNLEFAAEIAASMDVRPTLFVTTRAISGEWWPPVDRWYAVGRAASSREASELYGLHPRASQARARYVLGNSKVRFVQSCGEDRDELLRRQRRELGVTSAECTFPRFLAEDELRQLSRAGWYIGPHGHEHRSLPDLSPAEATIEVCESVRAVRGLNLANPSRWYAYADGRYDRATAEWLRDVIQSEGYVGALTIDGGDVDPLRSRWTVPRFISDPTKTGTGPSAEL